MISATTKGNMLALEALQILLWLAAWSPSWSHVNARCWDAFLAVSALYHFYKVETLESNVIWCIQSDQAFVMLFKLSP